MKAAPWESGCIARKWRSSNVATSVVPSRDASATSASRRLTDKDADEPAFGNDHLLYCFALSVRLNRVERHRRGAVGRSRPAIAELADQRGDGGAAVTGDRRRSAHRCGDHVVVYVPAPAAVAYAVPGRRPQVVVSDGLASAIGPEALSFVIEHERAHLRRRHGRYLLLAALVEAVAAGVAPVARSALALRLAVERAADEEAAGADPRRRRRSAAVLRRLAGAPWQVDADLPSLRYRAGQLRAAPDGGALRAELIAAAGIAALVALLTVAVGHVGGDVPGLVAAVR